MLEMAQIRALYKGTQALALMPVSEALTTMVADAAPLSVEMVALHDAWHRVLAADVAARRTQPPVAMSAMDGYALRSADASEVGSELEVIGEVAAGRPFSGSIGRGQAARIFTGGVVPQGADAVVIQEDTVAAGGRVTINHPAIAGRHIREAGVDFREGDILLQKGKRLTDRDISLAAGMNHAELPVWRRPRVAILATGDELVLPGTEPGPGQIVLSNGYALHALARAEGAETFDLGVAADRMDATTDHIRRAAAVGADLLITTGGASVGDHDLVKPALEAEGYNMTFWKIAMRPGKPMMFGRSAATRVIGLPGNPVSSYICAWLFMVPLIRALAGRDAIHHQRHRAILGSPLKANDGREDYLRAQCVEQADGTWLATPVSLQDSSLLGRLAAAQALVIRPPFAPQAPAGSPCEILRLPD